MSDGWPIYMRFGDAFCRAHHEACCRSDLNQGEHCELHPHPLKVSGKWRARFKAEPEAPHQKLPYRRGGLSHTLNHRLSHTLSHMTKGEGPVVPPDPRRAAAPVQ